MIQIPMKLNKQYWAGWGRSYSGKHDGLTWHIPQKAITRHFSINDESIVVSVSDGTRWFTEDGWHMFNKNGKVLEQGGNVTDRQLKLFIKMFSKELDSNTIFIKVEPCTENG